MRVTIVTVCLNQAPYIEEAIRSVLEQDYRDLEYIVVDAGSIDGSRQLIDRYKSRLSATIFEPDNGPADGLNKAFRIATGDLYGFLNADDVLGQSAVRRAVEYLQRNPTVDAIYSDGKVIDESGRKIRRVLSTSWNVIAYAYGACICFQPGSFYRKERFWRAGAFNVQNRTCWDGELLVDIALSGGRVMYLPGATALFRVHSRSITGSGRLRESYLSDVARIRNKIFRTLGIAESRAQAILYILKRYVTRFQTVFERMGEAVRAWYRH